jgi:hypothetical protein
MYQQGGAYPYPSSSYGYEGSDGYPSYPHQSQYEVDPYYYGNGGAPPPGNLQQSPTGYKRGQQFEPYYGNMMYPNSFGGGQSHQVPVAPVKPKNFSGSKNQTFTKPPNLECNLIHLLLPAAC